MTPTPGLQDDLGTQAIPRATADNRARLAWPGEPYVGFIAALLHHQEVHDQLGLPTSEAEQKDYEAGFPFKVRELHRRVLCTEEYDAAVELKRIEALPLDERESL